MKTIVKLQFYFLLIGLIAILSNGCTLFDDSIPKNCTSTAIFNPSLVYGTMTDQEGNTYKTITIGTQTWMAENLRTTTYRDGSPIPRVKDEKKWEELSTGARCTYENTTDKDTICTYGRLYNWYTVSDSRNIAPEGWHIPTRAEWAILRDFLGGEDVAGGKMRETGTIHWDPPTTATIATNESGFTALPSCSRGVLNIISSDYRKCAYYWSSTEYEAPNAWIFSLTTYYDSGILISKKTDGFAIRCIKD